MDLCNELETILNTLLLSKLTKFLSYDKYDILVAIENSQNRDYDCSLHPIFSNITIEILLNRFANFKKITYVV